MIDPLPRSAILTNTQFRITFAPRDPKERVIAMQFQVPEVKATQMQSLMKLGSIHVQIKAGFAAERHIELTGPEVMLLLDALDKFVTELPAASRAVPIKEQE